MATYRYRKNGSYTDVVLPPDAEGASKVGSFLISPDVSFGCTEGDNNGKLRVTFPRGYEANIDPAIDTVILGDTTIEPGTYDDAGLRDLLANSSVFLKPSQDGGVTPASGDWFDIIDGVFFPKLSAFDARYGGGVVIPTATNVAFTGTQTQGQTLTGTYIYSGGTEGTSLKKWYRSDNSSGLNRTAISGATASTYVLQAGDVGKFIQFAVTPRNAGGTSGAEVFSTYSGAIAASGGSYTFTRRLRANLTSQYGADAPVSAFTWNNLKPVSLSTDQSYLSPNLVTETNIASTIKITNIGNWDGSTNSLFEVYGTPADGVYPYEIIGSCWKFNRDGGNKLRLTGLDDTKYYQLYVGATDDYPDRSIAITINGETKTKPVDKAYGTISEDEFTSEYNTEFKNKQSTGGILDIDLNSIGFYIGLIGSVILEESVMTKP